MTIGKEQIDHYTRNGYDCMLYCGTRDLDIKKVKEAIANGARDFNSALYVTENDGRGDSSARRYITDLLTWCIDQSDSELVKYACSPLFNVPTS